MLRNTASKIITGVIALACLLGPTQTAMADDATSQATTHTVTYLDWKGDTIATRTVTDGSDATDIGLAGTTWLADPDMNFDNVDGWRDGSNRGGHAVFTKDGLQSDTKDLVAFDANRKLDTAAVIHVEARADYSNAQAPTGGIGFRYTNMGQDEGGAWVGFFVCQQGDADCVVDKNMQSDSSGEIAPWFQMDNNTAATSTFGTAVLHHMQLTQVDPTTHNGVARDGYVFTGWDKNLSTVTGDVTVTAQYKPVQYTIHYDPNGGTGSLPDQTMTYDQSSRLRPHDGFTRGGYVFTGWNSTADGTGKAWAENQTVSNLLAHDNAVGTLYAQWRRIPETSLPDTGGTMDNHKFAEIVGGGGLLIMALPLLAMRRRLRR